MGLLLRLAYVGMRTKAGRPAEALTVPNPVKGRAGAIVGGDEGDKAVERHP